MNTELVTSEKKKLAQFEPAAKVLAVTAMAETLNYILRRNYLEQITVATTSDEKFPFNYYLKDDAKGGTEPFWLKIEQVGLPVSSTLHTCFDALQRILHSCNTQSQILFLVVCDNKKFNMYLGVRLREANDRNFIKSLENFARGCWAGLNMKAFGRSDEGKDIYAPIAEFKKNNGLAGKNLKYQTVLSLTGIPTLDLDEKKQYPMSIDHFLAGIRDKNIAYMIVADPVPAQNINQALFEFRDMSGQIESLKSMNLQLSTSATHTACTTWSESTSGKDFSGIKKFALDVGKSVLNVVDEKLGFKPVVAINKAFKNRTFKNVAIGAGAIAGVKIAVATGGALVAGTIAMPAVAATLGAAGLASTFIPQKSKTSGGSESDAETFSETLGQTLINKHAENSAMQLNKYAQRYELGRAIGMWNVGVYLFGDESDAKNAALQLRAINSGSESVYEPIRIHDITSVLEKEQDNKLVNPFKTLKTPSIYTAVGEYIFENPLDESVFENPLGQANSEIKTILTTQELSSYINFPLRSVPGISVVDSCPDFSLNEQTVKENVHALNIGKLLDGGTETKIDCYLPLDTLSRHTLVAGVNGSGKTNTVLSVLSELQKQKTPFLVIEPAKTEYVDWAVEYNKGKAEKDQIRIFMPGDNTSYKGYKFKDKLRFNPFEVICLDGVEPRVLSHIDRVKSIFAAAFPMQEILPVIMENLIYSVYDIDSAAKDQEQKYACNWFDEKSPNYRKVFPQLSTACDRIESVIKSLGYDLKTTGTLTGCLKTRIKSLTMGWKKEMLDNERLEAKGWKDLFSTPCVINLSAAGDDVDKAFIMSLLLQFLYEYRIAEAEQRHDHAFSDAKCRHLVVVEEAHRIMSHCPNPEQPKHNSGMMFSGLLSEVRAYGQGLMIVDQVPVRLIPDAVKNTNIKIIHKLVAADDAKIVSESMGLSEQQQKIISKLSTGQAIVVGTNSAEVSAASNADIYWVKIKDRRQA